MFASTRTALKTFGLGRTKPFSNIGTTSICTTSPSDAAAKPRPTSVFECYVCDSPMALVEESEVPEFGVEDLRRHTMRCETCGMLADRVYHHMVGYDRGLVL